MRYLSFLFLTPIIFFNACSNSSSYKHLEINFNDTTLSKEIIQISEKIAGDPNNAEYFYLRSNAWIKENNFVNALLDISSALQLQPENAVYNFKKADLLMEKDSVDVNEAKKLYIKATQLEPNFEDAHFKLGKLYLARQEYENALASFDTLIQIDLNNSRAYFWKGIAFKENKFNDQAEKMFFKTVEIDNTYYDAYMQLAEIYSIKDPNTAFQFYENALRINPNSDEALYGSGLLMQQQGRFRDAYQNYAGAILINKGHKFASFNKAFIDVKFGNYEDAIKTLDQILQLEDTYSNAITLRGLAYEKSGNKRMAIENYNSALSINSKDSIAKESLKLIK